MASKLQILTLYKSLLREASKFPAYNFRMYGLRRIRDGFKMNKNLVDGVQIKAKYDDGMKNLETIKRQVLVSTLYRTDNLVIENTK